MLGFACKLWISVGLIFYFIVKGEAIFGKNSTGNVRFSFRELLIYMFFGAGFLISSFLHIRQKRELEDRQRE